MSILFSASILSMPSRWNAFSIQSNDQPESSRMRLISPSSVSTSISAEKPPELSGLTAFSIWNAQALFEVVLAR